MAEDKTKESGGNSQEVLDRALQRVLDERSFVRNLTTNMRNNWLRWYEITRMFRLKNMNTINRVFLPLGWEQVEKIAPRITAHDPKYELLPIKNSALPLTGLVGEWLNFMWEEKNLRRQARLMVKNGLIYGSGFVKLDMEMLTRKEVVERTEVGEEEVEQVNPATGQVEMVKVPVEEVVEEEIEINSLPIFRTVDIFDIDIDPRVECIEDARGIIHTIRSVSFSDLQKEAEDFGYFGLEAVKELGQFSDLDDKGDKLNTRGIPNQGGSSGTSEGVDLNDLTVREYWGRFSEDCDPAKEEEYVITVVNDAVVIRMEKNPFVSEDVPGGVRPFELYVDHDVPNELYGIGEIEPTETLQVGINKIKNQRLDNVDLVMNRMWVYDRAGGINPRDLKSYPGNVIPADDINSIQVLSTPDVTNSSFAEEDRYLRDFQLATGVVEAAGGGGRDDFINTATGQKIRVAKQNSRYGLKIENLEDTLARIGLKMLQMMNALEDEVFVIRREDPVKGGFKFSKVKRKALQEALQGMAVKVKAGSTISDDYEDRRNDAIARWNLSVAAFNAGVLQKEDLVERFKDLEMEAFGKKYMAARKKPGASQNGLMQLLTSGIAGLGGEAMGANPGLNPSNTQISPQTLVPNGAQPGIGINPVGPPPAKR